MYNKIEINKLIDFIQKSNTLDKTILSNRVQKEFNLTKDRSVFYCDNFAIRFCKASNRNFGNTVLSLSMLQKYDNLPFMVCLVTPKINYLFLSNTTLLKKISHSSHELRVNNIKGSFNGSDIIKNIDGINNEPKNFEYLFDFHQNFTFLENLERLVEETNNISATGKRFSPSDEEQRNILHSIKRSISFLASRDYQVLDNDLKDRVNAVSNEIAIAAFIENVNLRGRIIEFLITSPSDSRATLIDALHNKTPLPEIYTSDELGDYYYKFDDYDTATDIKTKILFLSSNPKGYNIDKLLYFLSKDNTIYLIYIVAIDENKKISTRLCSIYNRQLLNGTRIMQHWAGRNSRGVTQFSGHAITDIISNFDNSIDSDNAKSFILKCINQD